MENRFHNSLTNPDEFTITFELVPGQGSGGKQVDRILEFARLAAEDGRIKALSITDNAGGHPAMAPVAIGSEIQALGIEPLIHFSLKDKNRNQVESHLFLYHRQRFHALLVMGGDFPKPRYYGQAKPVFDLDTIQALQLMRDMETGEYSRHASQRTTGFAPISFFRGCVVSPFKTTEPEQIWQYGKLLRKIRAGADFIVTQLGFDIRKFEELILFLRQHRIRQPVLANVFIPSLGVARLMARGGVPGVNVPLDLIRRMEKEASDPRARLVRAAKMLCVVRGLGYHGVHIGGNGLDFNDVRYILDQAEAMKHEWRSFRQEVHSPVPFTWYLYDEKDRPVRLAPGQRPGGLRLHQTIHHYLFSRKTLSGRIVGQICRLLGRTPRGYTVLRTVERMIKTVLFDCRMCGDCTLAESTFLCPQSGCPKKLVNGPCGGSQNTSCEVHPEKRCFWVRVYDRLPPGTTPARLGTGPVLPPKDWRLDQSSSWYNYFTGTDHHRLDGDKAGEETEPKK
ncbi:methylenetetrahydrofolate reductase C-terminal domain-containing protein [Desulfolithobacter sp.]